MSSLRSFGTLLIFISFIICVCQINADKNKDKNALLEIKTISSFNNKIKNSKEVWVVKLYSKKCGSCKDFESIWEGLLPLLQKKFKVAAVNIDEGEGVNLATELSVLKNLGIPSLIVVKEKLIYNSGYYKHGFSVDKLSRDNCMDKVLSYVDNFQVNNEGKYLKQGIKTDI